ncbi:RNA polymerase sigma factor [Phenylobacterium sp.]|uniref:RNA polymerase sigma factor n=1 Tax=Phenylobacterium sp. TaxID=1871053 RepID=UPI0035AEB517
MARAQDDGDGPSGSLEGLYRRYSAWLGRKLRRRFGQALGEEAEDLVQEAYLRIAPYEAAGVVRHPKALLLRVANNLALNHLRRVGRAGGAALRIEEVTESDEHGLAASQDEAVLLQQIVSALPPPLRDVFVLSRFAGMTNQDIAEACGLSVKTVEWRMTRALAIVTLRLRD